MAATINVDKNYIFCKECGAKNDINDKQCKKCGIIMNTLDSPLDGTDRVKVVSFFAFLAPAIFLGGLSVPIILMALGAIYIMKKDKVFSPILKAKQYIKYYLVLLAIGITLAVPTNYYIKRHTVHNPAWDVYRDTIDKHVEELQKSSPELSDISRSELVHRIKKTYNLTEPSSSHDPRILRNILGLLFAALLATFLIVSTLLWIFNMLFFNPIRRHKHWVEKKGIFANLEKEEDSAIDIIGRDNLSAFSVADELIKWNELLEKGLITQDEFEKAKQKLLNEGGS